MTYVLSKFVPPRKTFISDATAEELRVMSAHADYWAPHLGAGIVVAMGPVKDPEGDWGVFIANAPSLAWLERMQAEDPALRGLGFRFENFIMPSLRVAPVEPLAPVSSVTP